MFMLTFCKNVVGKYEIALKFRHFRTLCINTVKIKLTLSDEAKTTENRFGFLDS